MGNCIPIAQRCDGKIDCPNDMSDETNCSIVIKPKHYQVQYQPMTKLQVGVKIHVKNVFDIDEVAMEFKTRVRVDLSWYDPRLTFQNLRSEDEKNLIDFETGQGIWKPSLLFHNSNHGERTKYDEDTSFSIKRLGPAQSNDFSHIHENLLYKGSENVLQLSRYYTVSLQCLYKMNNYPFDQQNCPIKIAVPFQYDNKMELVLDKDPTYSDLQFLQYTFKGLGGAKGQKSNQSIQIEVKLQRMFSLYMTTTFLPTTCLIMIAELTLFMDISHFETSIMVALTSMLVMYTLYQSISATLPQTAYIKMIDCWLLIGLIIPFAVFIILVVVEYFNGQEKKRLFIKSGSESEPMSRRILQIGKLTVPLTTLMFFFIYATIAIYMYSL